MKGTLPLILAALFALAIVPARATDEHDYADVLPQDDLRTSFSEIEWRGPRRFVLREHRLFLARDASFARSLGAYGKQTDKTDEGRLFFEFSAEADCRLMPGNRYRIADLRVGKFGAQ